MQGLAAIRNPQSVLLEMQLSSFQEAENATLENVKHGAFLPPNYCWLNNLVRIIYPEHLKEK